MAILWMTDTIDPPALSKSGVKPSIEIGRDLGLGPAQPVGGEGRDGPRARGVGRPGHPGRAVEPAQRVARSCGIRRNGQAPLPGSVPRVCSSVRSPVRTKSSCRFRRFHTPTVRRIEKGTPQFHATGSATSEAGSVCPEGPEIGKVLPRGQSDRRCRGRRGSSAAPRGLCLPAGRSRTAQGSSRRCHARGPSRCWARTKVPKSEAKRCPPDRISRASPVASSPRGTTRSRRPRTPSRPAAASPVRPTSSASGTLAGRVRAQPAPSTARAMASKGEKDAAHHGVGPGRSARPDPIRSFRGAVIVVTRTASAAHGAERRGASGRARLPRPSASPSAAAPKACHFSITSGRFSQIAGRARVPSSAKLSVPSGQ